MCEKICHDLINILITKLVVLVVAFTVYPKLYILLLHLNAVLFLVFCAANSVLISFPLHSVRIHF